MTELTIGAGLVRGLLELAVAKGAGHAALLTAAGIAPRDLEDPDGRIAFDSYKTLMRTAKILTRDPALALHYAEAADLSEVSIVGLICNASETMGEAFRQTNRYARLAVEFEGMETQKRFEHVRRGGEVWMVDNRRNPNEFPELTETTFGRMAYWTRPYEIGRASCRERV